MNILDLSVNEKHDLLLNTLDVLHDSACWKSFMGNLEILVPDNETGRKNIAGTFVESLGFGKWTDYVVTSRENNGLGWSVNGWNGYRRAWKTTKDCPWLLDTEMKPGTINAYVAKLQKQGIDMPSSIEEYNLLKEQWKAEKKQEKTQEKEPIEKSHLVRLTFWEWLTYPFVVGFKR